MKHLVPASSETAKAESVLLTGGPVSQSGMVPWSWRLRPSLQPLPPVLHPPPPPSQGLGRWLRGQMALEVQAASWARHPCSPPPTTLLHSCSYFHPLTPPLLPLPPSKPLSPSARQCRMTGQTQPFTKMPPMSPLCSCLG